MKHTIKLYDRINSLNKLSFSEDDVKLFLIEIREELSTEKFLREICDFVAHPKRNKGICHSRVDSRFAKMKFNKEGYKKIEPLISENLDKPWSFFSDIILSYIQVEAIPKKLFEIVILEGIEEIDEQIFIQFYNHSKEKIKEIITTSYRKNHDMYVLLPSLTTKQKESIDDILKFIRGTITGKPAFNQSEIVEEINKAISKFCLKFSLEPIVLLSKALDELTLCIVCILHNAIFELFDGTKGVSFLTIERNLEEQNLSTISLYAETDNFSFPIISTELKAIDYIDEIKQIDGSTVINEYVYAFRNKKGDLQLHKHST
jgi:hypothetical protein